MAALAVSHRHSCIMQTVFSTRVLGALGQQRGSPSRIFFWSGAQDLKLKWYAVEKLMWLPKRGSNHDSTFLVIGYWLSANFITLCFGLLVLRYFGEAVLRPANLTCCNCPICSPKP